MSRSGSGLARANFKRYSQITNPLAPKDGPAGRSAPTWLESEGTRSDQRGSSNNRSKDEGSDGKRDETREDRQSDEDDPFGLGAIMAKDAVGKSVKGQKDETVKHGDGRNGIEGTRGDRGDGKAHEEDEEDLFGLGAILARSDEGNGYIKDDQNADATNDSGGQRSDMIRSLDQKVNEGQRSSGTGDRRCPVSLRADAQRDDETAEAPLDTEHAFISAPTFDGRRDGYVFKKGHTGVGYYVDKLRVRAAVEARKLNRQVHKRRMDAPGSVESTNEDSRDATIAGRGEQEDPPLKKQAIDVKAAVDKLSVLLLKPKKTSKAASLLADLMEAEMRQENSRLFLRALRPLAEAPTSEAAIAAGAGGARAFKVLLERAEWLGRAADVVRAVTWELLFVLRYEVQTDDSFQFARAIKRLRTAIEALGDATGSSNSSVGDDLVTTETEGHDGAAGGEESRRLSTELSLERKSAVIVIMQEAFKSYHLAWARASIEPAFKSAADRRRLFPEGNLRDTLDEFINAITKRQRNPGGSMAPPVRTVRAHNSVAHPLLNKRSDVIR